MFSVCYTPPVSHTHTNTIPCGVPVRVWLPNTMTFQFSSPAQRRKEVCVHLHRLHVHIDKKGELFNRLHLEVNTNFSPKGFTKNLSAERSVTVRKQWHYRADILLRTRLQPHLFMSLGCLKDFCLKPQIS